MIAINLEHAAELVTEQGPTGEFVEVIRGEIHDAGGNVLFSGTADECVREQRKFVSGFYTRRHPTEWRRVDGEVFGSNNHWGFAG